MGSQKRGRSRRLNADCYKTSLQGLRPGQLEPTHPDFQSYCSDAVLLDMGRYIQLTYAKNTVKGDRDNDLYQLGGEAPDPTTGTKGNRVTEISDVGGRAPDPNKGT